jgi:NAD(P)H-dependent FMN reductase
LQRARYALQLVLSDPGAHVHNAGFAAALLDETERQLTQADGGS